MITPRTRPVKSAAIVNSVALNGGDAAILLASRLLLQRAFPSLERLAVFSSDAAAVRRHYPDIEILDQPLDPFSRRSAFRIIDKVLRQLARIRDDISAKHLLDGRRWLGSLLMDARTRRFVEMLPEFDLICTAGGTYLTEAYEWRNRIAVLQLAKAQGLPVVFLTQSLGVETGEDRIRLLHEVLPRFDLFLVRDPPSVAFLRKLGVAAERVHQVSDAAFVLAQPDTWREKGQKKCCMRVAVSVREWSNFARGNPQEGMERYLNSVAAAIDWLVREREAHVTFLSTCQGVPEYRFDDSRTAERVIDKLSKDARQSVGIETGFHDPCSLSRRYAAFDFVIATRMHAAILALNTGVPVLPIAYEFKTTELWKSFGLAEYVADIEEIEAKAFVALCERFVEDLLVIGRALRDAVRQAHASALSSSELIRNALK